MPGRGPPLLRCRHGTVHLLLYDRPGDWLSVPPERLERLIAEYSALVQRMQEVGSSVATALSRIRTTPKLNRLGGLFLVEATRRRRTPAAPTLAAASAPRCGKWGGALKTSSAAFAGAPVHRLEWLA